MSKWTLSMREPRIIRFKGRSCLNWFLVTCTTHYNILCTVLWQILPVEGLLDFPTSLLLTKIVCRIRIKTKFKNCFLKICRHNQAKFSVNPIFPVIIHRIIFDAMMFPYKPECSSNRLFEAMLWFCWLFFVLKPAINYANVWILLLHVGNVRVHWRIVSSCSLNAKILNYLLCFLSDSCLLKCTSVVGVQRHWHLL